MHPLNLKNVLPVLPVVEIELIPARCGGELGARELGQRREVEAIDDKDNIVYQN